jgi:hypothetical protein
MSSIPYRSFHVCGFIYFYRTAKIQNKKEERYELEYVQKQDL